MQDGDGEQDGELGLARARMSEEVFEGMGGSGAAALLGSTGSASGIGVHPSIADGLQKANQAALANHGGPLEVGEGRSSRERRPKAQEVDAIFKAAITDEEQVNLSSGGVAEQRRLAGVAAIGRQQQQQQQQQPAAPAFAASPPRPSQLLSPSSFQTPTSGNDATSESLLSGSATIECTTRSADDTEQMIETCAW